MPSMGRPRRVDAAGTWHHAWNRGIASKPIFETSADIRRFLAALARAVRRGEIEIHAFVVMTTHFHLLIRSLAGSLSAVMGRVLSDFTRYYNRTRERDGTVWKGRFCSKVVSTYGYRATLLRYIDQNPVVAGMARAPWEYEHGSAKRFVEDSCGWLSRSWVDGEIRICTGRSPAEGGRYQELFSMSHADAIARLVQARQCARVSGDDPMDELMAAPPLGVRKWLEQRSLLADGRKPGHPIIDPLSVLKQVAAYESERGDFEVQPRRRVRSGLAVLRAALLRDCSGQTYAEVAVRLGVHRSHVSDLYADHARLLRMDSRYREIVVTLTLALLSQLRSFAA